MVPLLLAVIRLADLAGQDPLGQVHAELPAGQPAIQDVFGVTVRFEQRLKQVLAVVQMLADAPFLHADDLDNLAVARPVS